MKKLLFLVTILIGFTAKAQLPGSTMHCGYDFTSYLVLHVHEQGKEENVKNLKITVVDSLGRDLINVNNMYSWSNANKPLQFSLNYLIDDNNKRLEEGATATKERWFFPFAKDNYLLSVANTFPADSYSIKVEDTTGAYKPVIIQLYAYNMYVLCSNESRDAAIKFGRKTNKPLEIVLEKK
ncbi:hypothetical protein FUA48_15480 [Flavobacterium alkalisoli]|uniref:Uncharacterized protein n=1 Tax=Flavobacterium alkalisoli TaxID=2602769 RepID=A0A5B9FY47_9FLAO|nr:hypothetical protein [Flavobacterium alkalisoli]QEE50926.1 hypothetical protein FUA48_15480 [Flavobacterium alkalisoli]